MTRENEKTLSATQRNEAWERSRDDRLRYFLSLTPTQRLEALVQLIEFAELARASARMSTGTGPAVSSD